jgi:hypothetical protein
MNAQVVVIDNDDVVQGARPSNSLWVGDHVSSICRWTNDLCVCVFPVELVGAILAITSPPLYLVTAFIWRMIAPGVYTFRGCEERPHVFVSCLVYPLLLALLDIAWRPEYRRACRYGHVDSRLMTWQRYLQSVVSACSASSTRASRAESSVCGYRVSPARGGRRVTQQLAGARCLACCYPIEQSQPQPFSSPRHWQL